MNSPAPEWPAAPAPDPTGAAPVAAPMAPPAPPAPLAAAPDAPAIQAMPQFAPPASPEAMLDVTAPLMPASMPQQPSAPDFAAHPHVEHPTSLAMPTAEPTHAPAGAMPTFAEVGSFSPQQIGGVTTAHPADLADRAALAPDVAPAHDSGVDPTGQWWAPGIALVLAVAAVAWQIIAFYARVQLPVVRTSGNPLTNFDNIVGSLPLADSALGQGVGVLLAAGALGIVLYGSRRGLREPQLQITIGAIAAVSLLAMLVLPMLRG
jgi:hypothetical protein